MFFYFSVMEPTYAGGRTWLSLVTWTCGSWSESQHDLYFTVQWFCLISWRLFDVCTSYFGSMNQMFDLIINVGHWGLYSMVQWFCHISWRLFDVWTILFGIMSQYDPKFDLKMNVGHCDLYFMISVFALYLEDYLMYVHHSLGIWISTTTHLI